MPITTDRDKLRLTIGDTNSAAQEFQDDELDYFLDLEGSNILKAAASACDAAAAKWARAYDFETDAQAFKRSTVAKMYAERAATFRARAAGLVAGPGGALIGTVSTIDSTRVDGFSDDIPNQDVGVTTVNPRRRFYGEEDAPF